MYPALWCLAAIILFLCLRLVAAWHTRHRGCDAWFFLLCAEQLRMSRRLPVCLPSLYMLEPDEQWYPPGFMVFCALFPDTILKKFYWALAHFVDCLIACILFFVGYAATGLIVPALWGVAVYALIPSLISEYSSLTSRPLGCFLQLSFVLLSYGWIHGNPWLFFPAVIFGVLLLYTHKLSIQALWFLLPFFALAERNAYWLSVLPVVYCAAFLIQPTLFLKILRAHWDIIRFWHRNWPLLGAHQVNDSPLYGSHPLRAGYYAQTMSSFCRTFAWTVLQNTAIVFTLPALLFYSQLDSFMQFCLWWVIGVHLWAAAIQTLPFLRCIGLGIQYLKYSYLPAIVLAVAILSFQGSPVQIFHILAIAVLFWLLYKYARLLRHYQKNTFDQQNNEDLETHLNFLKKIPDARVLTIPLNLADITAYKTRRPVCWGAHGYGFTTVANVLPVLQKSLQWLTEHYDLTYLLLDERYATPEKLHISPESLISKSEYYSLYSLKKIADTP